MKSDPTLVYEKIAEKKYNRIAIPKKFIDKWGSRYLMYVYEDKIELIPFKENKGDKQWLHYK